MFNFYLITCLKVILIFCMVLALSGKGSYEFQYLFSRCPLHCLLYCLILLQCENSICFSANETNCSYVRTIVFRFTGRILSLVYCLFRSYSLFACVFSFFFFGNFCMCILLCVLAHYVFANFNFSTRLMYISSCISFSFINIKL